MNIFVARQPIFDKRQNVVAYELLFRSGLENFFRESDADHASSRVISDTFLSFGLDTMTGGKHAFINISRDVLISDYISLLPKESVVLELLESVAPDETVIGACRKLKKAGYQIALDDFVYRDDMMPLLQLAHIVKMDFIATPVDQRASLSPRLRAMGLRLLAEKVETHEEFNWAISMGYTLFQGYFFAKPVVMSGKDVPGFKLNYIRLLGEINDPNFSFSRIESIIKQDVAISYKLLRYINSAAFGFRDEIHSIHEALVLVGELTIRKLASLWIFAGLGQDKPEELVVCSVLRSQFCESLAPLIGMLHRQSELLLLGMFSLIDAIVDRPMTEILTQLPVTEDVGDALLGKPNSLRPALDSILAYEKGDWNALSIAVGKLGLKEDVIPQIYLKSIEWTGRIFQMK